MYEQSKRNNHWFGSTIPSSTYLQSGEYRPALVLWTRDSSVLSSELVHPDDAQSALERTFRQALAQEKRGPDQLSVDNLDCIDALRPLAPDVEFALGSDGFVAVMAEDIMAEIPELSPPDSFFETDIDAGTLRAFFSVMKELSGTGVLIEDDCQFVSVTIPTLDINDAVLWLGNDCCSFGRGFALFPTMEAFRSWMRVNICMTDEWEDSDNRSFLQSGFASLCFASDSQRREIKKNSFAIKDGSYPSLNAHDSDGVRQPAERTDYLLARFLAKGICELKAAVHNKDEAQASLSLLHDGELHEAHFVYPAPQASPDDYLFTYLEH